MSRLTIEQAISHAREVAEKNKANCERNTIVIPNRWISDTQCAEEHEQLAGWLEELQRYKDLEEQGRLIELPCKVGDYVYKIHNNDWKQFLRGGGRKLEIIKSVFTYKDIPCIGTLVFLTKEEAEAKLAEMEGAE